MKSMNYYTLLPLVAVAVTFSTAPLKAATADDRRIVSAAKDSYVYRTYLKDDHIKIQSKDGMVTLKGEVATPSHKEMAEDTLESLPGVKNVENRLTVKAGDQKSDSLIEFKVKSALLFHRSVSGTKIDVSSQNGKVILRGTASSQAEKELATEYAKDIEGVTEVDNQLEVVSTSPGRTTGEAVDDASITAQVKGALLTHRSTSALKTKVTTRNGEVILTGEAKNQAEKDLATKLANDIRGVKSVMNNMEVRE